MALIQITNTLIAKNDSSELSNNVVQTNSVIDSLEYIMTEIKQYWEESQQDAQKFASGLETNIANLKTIAECNKDFASAIEKYADTQDKIGQQTTASI